jgi:hypothetical protein
MLTSVKLASCIAVVAAAATLPQPPAPTKPATPPAQPPTPAQPPAQPKAPRQLTEQDCREALDRVREIRHEINAIEKRLDDAQTALNAAAWPTTAS